jgi:hypothetical protein
MDNNELLRVVVSDLDHLANTWNQKSVSDDDLRRGSAQLRHLLIEGTLLRAWRAKGFDKQPTILAPRLESCLKDHASIMIAVAGGGEYEGLQGALAVVRKHGSEAQTQNDDDITYPFKLTKFVTGCALVINGKRIKREEVIKYVANKLGGAHYDERRSESAFAALDNAAGLIDFLGKNAVYFELLSIGQLVAKAPDVVALRKVGKQEAV